MPRISRTCCAWAGCPRRGWPRPRRALRELVRHRAKLVALRSGLKASVHAVLAKQGVAIPVTDLFGVRGRQLLAAAALDAPYRARVNSLCRVIEAVGFEIDVAAGLVAGRLARHPGYRAIQAIPGVGPILAAVFVAEIGDVDRFSSARHLTSWAGLTPRHRESDTTVHRGPITKQGPLGRDRSRPEDTGLGRVARVGPTWTPAWTSISPRKPGECTVERRRIRTAVADPGGEHTGVAPDPAREAVKCVTAGPDAEHPRPAEGQFPPQACTVVEAP
jgi:hypothetical protein